jgi:hypothetical protein
MRTRHGWTGHERAGHGRIVSEHHGYLPIPIYINSLSLSVCDGQARHGLGTGGNWARTRHEHGRAGHGRIVIYMFNYDD